MNITLTDDEVGILLTAAVHAPSLHNIQPWRFEVHGPVVDVLLDAERTLPATDPLDRAARIGIGAAVFNIRVAAAVLGHDARVVAEPDPGRPDIAARVFLGARSTPVPRLGGLYGDLTRRRTYRGPLLDQPVPPRVQARLDDAARAEGATLRWLDQDAKTGLASLLRRTDAEDLQDEDRLHERLTWIGGDRRSEGVQESALGPIPVKPALVRNLSAGFDSTHRTQAVFEHDPAIAVLCTRHEDAEAWLKAGMALQRILLVATSYDLAASFLNQVLERPSRRTQLRELLGGRSWPQTVIRIGYPAQPHPVTSRRDWHDSYDHWF
ncbi:Acg family FMN-binding oxidoreductase [Kribbella sp. NPDC002412]